MNTTPTPRTDAAVNYDTGQTVAAQLARTLELELRAALEQIGSLKNDRDELEEKLRNAIIECGGNDPSDSEDATAETVIDELVGIHKRQKDDHAFMVDSYETRIGTLESQLEKFKHTHVNNGVDDACKQCGLDLRNEIHTRL
jgi:hypothetical protein